jgi:hypothetical protein
MLIFNIETVAGKHDAGNEVHGKNVKMVREIHNNEIGELIVLIGVSPADLEFYLGFIGGDAFSGNIDSEFS